MIYKGRGHLLFYLLFSSICFTLILMVQSSVRTAAATVDSSNPSSVDFNHDGLVNRRDIVVQAKNASVGEYSDPSMSIYDLNGDKQIDILDMSKLSKEYCSTTSNALVVIDAGHGGSDPGASGPTSLDEKDVTLKLALKVGKILQDNDVDVIFTRTDDTYVSLQERVDISNKEKTDCFVSIHENSYTSPSINGLETYYHAGSDNGLALAKSVEDSLVSALGLSDRGEKTADLYVTNHTTTTAILTEVGFISNPQQEKLLASDDYLTKCSQAIADGILNYLGLKN